MPPSPAELAAFLQVEAKQLGFTLTGFAPATDADTFSHFTDWLDADYAGEMHYLHAKREARQHPKYVLNSVQTVMMLGYDYGPPEPSHVAAYAQRPDYHDHLWAKLNTLAERLQTIAPEVKTKGVCDTAPLLERDFARRAGLGWFGKNTMLIHPQRGSFFFLCALLLNIELPTCEPFTKNHCGTCTACLDACPTQAFVQSGVLDARRCLSYHTIELRGPIPLEFREPLGSHLFGCDDCQTVCPWNRFALPNADFPPAPELVALDPLELLSLDDAAFRRRFRGTPMMRTKRSGLLRNACIVLGNTADENAIPALLLASQDADATIADAARWAIAQIKNEPKASAPDQR